MDAGEEKYFACARFARVSSRLVGNRKYDWRRAGLAFGQNIGLRP
jgi:hypothetical protein